MATRNGYLANLPLFGVLPAPLPQGLIEQRVPHWQVRINDAAFYGIAGSRSAVLPVTSYAVAREGYKAWSFFEDYYFRIHVKPRSIDVGNVLGSQLRTIQYWNAFPYAPVTLTRADVEGDSGILVTLPAGVTIPYESAPLEELTFDLTVTLSGPPSVDARFVIEAEGRETAVTITGRRIVLFPFRPQWRSGVDETITYPSWVIPASDGTEQTGDTSGSYPQRSFEYTTVTKDAIEAQRLENLLFTWQGRFFGLPIWTERKRTAAAAPAGASSLLFDTRAFSVEPRSLVVLLSEDGLTSEIREVDTVSPTGVTTVTPLEFDWPAGSDIYPVAVAVLNADMQVARETTRVGRNPVSFTCEPTATPSNAPVIAPAESYRGDELLLDPINWRTAMPVVFSSDRKVFQYSSAKISAHTYRGYSRFSRKHSWQLIDEDEIHAFRGLLERRRGVTTPMWMPSGLEDFTVAGSTNAVDSFVEVEPNAYANMVEQHRARRDIIIYFHGGGYVCRRITDSSLIGNVMRLQLDSPPGFDISPDSVMRISYLNLYRFSSPAVALRFLADRRAVVDADLITKVRKDDQ